jgi:hypothetical protein
VIGPQSHHELPALPIVVDQRVGEANGSLLPALPVQECGRRYNERTGTVLNREAKLAPLLAEGLRQRRVGKAGR